MEYIYTKRNGTYKTHYQMMVLKKETKTQIVALAGSRGEYEIRFNKDDKNERGCGTWDSPRRIISFEEYKEGVNKPINEAIAGNEEEIAAIQERIAELKAELIV